MENQTIGLVHVQPHRRTRLALRQGRGHGHPRRHGGGDHGPAASGSASFVSGIDISTVNIVAITVMVTLLACSVGGLAMVISIITGRGTAAILMAMLVAVLVYAWSSFVPMADAIADLAWLSPWHQYIATDPLGSGIDWASAALLAVLAVLPLVVGVYLFKRQDIPA